MGIPDRLYKIASAHLSRAKERWDEIDASAQQELDAYISSHPSNNDASAWDRAIGKINSARAGRELQPSQGAADYTVPLAEPSLDELEAKVAADQAGQTSPAPRPNLPQTDTLRAAYKMLGVEPGTDWLSVQSAYRKLRERASPDRFAQGSAEQKSAQDIQRRIDCAYTILSNTLDPSGDRFDRLEI